MEFLSNPSDPLISVILPVFNGELYIKDAIFSIINQTFGDFELIIVNDGSTDGSNEIINTFKDARIRYVINENNMGIVSSLNKGISLSNGKYIARMDADDVSVLTRFERQVDLLESDSTIGLCASQLKILGENKIIPYPISDEDIKFDFLLYNAIAHPAVMFRKQILSDHNIFYEREYFPAEDYRLWAKISKYCKFYNFFEPLLEYRLHEGSVSHSQRSKQMNVLCRIRSYYLLYWMNIWTEERESLLFRLFSEKSNLKKSELLKIKELLLLCIEKNDHFPAKKIESFLKSQWFSACNKSELNILFSLVAHAQGNVLFDYRYCFKLFVIQIKKMLKSLK